MLKDIQNTHYNPYKLNVTSLDAFFANHYI